MVEKAVFLLQELAEKSLTPGRYKAYSELVRNSNDARNGHPRADQTLEKANQYDKAEEIITWSTFAPLLSTQIDKTIKDGIVLEILKTALGRDFNEYLNDEEFKVKFEKYLPSPPSYSKRIQTISLNHHPIKYIRESAKDKEDLEGPSQVDVLLENSKLVVLGEVKFMSDLSCQVEYDPVRNQLARTIDVGLKYRGQRKLAVIVLSPEWGYAKNRLYYYKLRDYHEKPENILEDLPHRSLKEITDNLIGVGWISLERAASLTHKAAILRAIEQQEDVFRFYTERRIQLTI